MTIKQIDIFKIICELIKVYFIGLCKDMYKIYIDFFKGIKPFLCVKKEKIFLFFLLNKNKIIKTSLILLIIVAFFIFKFLFLTLLGACVGLILILLLILFLSKDTLEFNFKYPYIQGTLLVLFILFFLVGGAIIGYDVYEHL